MKTKFDPTSFLEASEFEIPRLKALVLPHASALFTLFSVLHPIPTNADETETGFVFLSWLNYSSCECKIGYSLVGSAIHLYLCVWSLGRVLATMNGYWKIPLLSYVASSLRVGSDGPIDLSLTVSNHTSAAIMNALIANVDTRPYTLVDITGLIQALYYILLLVPSPTVNLFVSYYGTILTGTSLWMTFFLASPPSGGWVLNYGREARYGNWNALWIPLVFYMLFTWMWAKQIGLACWASSTDRNSIDDELEDPSVAKPSALTALKLRLISTISAINRYTWPIFFTLIPLLPIFLFFYFRTHIQVHSDLYKWPSIYWLAFLIALISGTCCAWLTFLTFQIQFVVWKGPSWKEGIVVYMWENDFNIAVIY